MITRDYVMRQVHQLVQALAQVLFHRREESGEMVQAILEGAVMDVTGLSLERIRNLDRDGLMTLCSPDGTLSGELAVSLADLLREDTDERTLVRARWLYEAALATGSVVPADVHDRIAALPS